MDAATEARHWRQVADNLRADLAEARAELDRVKRGDWVMFDLWMREVRPGWRMWRIRRRREAIETMEDNREASNHRPRPRLGAGQP